MRQPSAACLLLLVVGCTVTDRFREILRMQRCKGTVGIPPSTSVT